MARRAGLLFMSIVGALVGLAFATTPAGAQAQVICDGQVATIVGTPEDDVLEGTEGRDVIAGLQGDDLILGFGGDDLICGGQGNDLLVGGQGFDVIFGAQGNDEIYAAGNGTLLVPGALADIKGSRIFAGAGDDIVYGSDRWDRMQGGPGDDLLLGFAGNDWMRGGPGADRVVGHKGKDDLHGGSGPDHINAERNDTNVRGGAGNDFCPALDGTNFRGCPNRFAVNPTDSTLPRAELPAQLAGGAQDTYVYLGFDANGLQIFIGITTDLGTAFADPRFNSIREISATPVTRGQALAIQQAVHVVQTQYINNVNPISPSASYYAAAVAWGDAWLAVNGYTNQ